MYCSVRQHVPDTLSF